MILRPLVVAAAAGALLLALSRSSLAITVGEVDSFAMDLENWGQGRPPDDLIGVTWSAAGGQGGGGYMRVQSQGGDGQSLGKIVVFNQEQWAGNYLTAGVTAISMAVNNFGNNPLTLRLVLGTGAAPTQGGDWLVSAVGTSVPALSGWTNIQFSLAENALLATGAYNTTMAGIVTVRLMHSPEQDLIGTPVIGVLGVDNVTAVGAATPIPGDFDGDGNVDGADLVKWRMDFGVAAGSNADGDSDSDGNDLLIWQRNLGMGTAVAASAAVPEPASAALLVLAALLLSARLRPARIRARS